MADGSLLVGDIGGTNARFAISEADGTLRDVQVLKVADFGNFDVALQRYVESLGEKPPVLCIASAGAMFGDEIDLTNASWRLSGSGLKSQFGFDRVQLINDFEAQARFAGTMQPSAGRVLKTGTPIEGAPVLTIGPGTGFGQSLFVPGSPPTIVPTEGGHRLLPVRNDRELRLYKRLEERFGHPPILEYVLSGRGMTHLYEAVSLEARGKPESLEPPAITDAALAGPGLARDSVLWFLDYLACAAADACLCLGARGGIAVSGGIVPRFEALLDEAHFGASFARPGLLQHYLKDAPVVLVTDPYAALHGAAACARDRRLH